jgi:hypothetical protein
MMKLNILNVPFVGVLLAILACAMPCGAELLLTDNDLLACLEPLTAP